MREMVDRTEVGANSRLSEMALIGAILLDSGVCRELEGRRIDEWMYYNNYAVVYRILMEMYSMGRRIDLVTAVAYIEGHPSVMELTHNFRVDIVAVLDMCMDCCPSVENVEHYVENIREMYNRRRVQRAGMRITEVMREAGNLMVGVDEIYGAVERELEELRIDIGLDRREGDIVYYSHSRLSELVEEWSEEVVEDWLDAGSVVMLAGRPKTGKSWLALSMAIGVASGGEWLGYPCRKGSVIYMALEDTEIRIKSRLELVSCGSIYDNLVVVTRIKRADMGGIGQLIKLIKEVGGVRLVVIDTYQMFRGDVERGSMIYQEDYRSISELREVAKLMGVSILLLHHLRKHQIHDSEDLVERVLGSTGIVGALDTILVLDKPRLSNMGNILRTGRDVEEVMYSVEFDPMTGLWKMLGDSKKYAQEKASEMILHAFSRVGPGTSVLTVSDLTEITGMSNQSIRKAVSRMAEDGVLIRVERGRYMLGKIAR